MSGWSVVLPVKPPVRGKSRLRGAVPGVPHRELATAIALDTLAAVLACPAVRRVVVVTDEPDLSAAATALGALVVPDAPADGLNAAFRHGADIAATARPGPGPALPGALGARVAALTGDLPALRPAELAAALRAAGRAPRSFLPDAEGTGTTLLSTLGPALDPRFGPGSAAAHAASGAVRLDGPWPSLRRDVDTAADLAEAALIGLGPRTAPLLDRRSA